MLTPTRRQFLRLTAGLGLGGAAAVFLEKCALSTAWAQGPADYKALVCVFLNGGNDGNQTVVPLSGATGFGAPDPTGGYPAYFAERSGPGLAIAAPPATGPEPANTLLRISPGAGNPNLGTFGLHPSLGLTFNATTGTVTIPIPGLKTLYEAGKVAVVCNVGTLPQTLSKAQYLAGVGRPDQLFSHSDQIRENQTCVFTAVTPPGVPGGTGWGGRTADQTLGRNGTATFPMQTSISGAPQFMSGASTFPLVINPAPTALNQVLVLNGFGTSTAEVARRNAFNQLRTVNKGANRLIDAASTVMDEALAVSAALSVDPQLTVPAPTVPGGVIPLTFPNTTLGNQLKQVAKVIKANLLQPSLGLQRQIFFCALGGFDTHQNQNATQPGLLQQVNQGLATFYYWLQNNAPAGTEPGLGDLTSKVTSFTLSDFSRTFNPAGQGGIVGSDHAWGSHFLVLGGAVNGGRFYGAPLPGQTLNPTVFPTLAKGSASTHDTDSRGRWIPSVSTLQYANTLAAWYGLVQDAAILDYVFPLLRTNFAQTNLGFV
jgi:uncharacterized protein (DUF1501 family)